MKLEVYVRTRYLHSEERRTIDIEEDLGIEVLDWDEYTDRDKDAIILEYLLEQCIFEYGYEEIE